jgi:hypothetical protein
LQRDIGLLAGHGPGFLLCLPPVTGEGGHPIV